MLICSKGFRGQPSPVSTVGDHIHRRAIFILQILAKHDALCKGGADA